MLVRRLGVFLIILAALPYACSPLYRFPEPRVFSGRELLNPYAGLKGRWQRANLHAHGTAWSGLTNGAQANAEIVDHYRRLGYSVTGVSNYQHISAYDDVATLPLYEHGYNITKNHQLAIGATRVEWFDFPLWQSLHNKQYVINRVARSAELVALVHPKSRNAYAPDDLQRLTGYQLIEVANGPFPADDAWDAALSSGHPVWAIANDDTHDLTDQVRSGRAWTMIDAPSPDVHDITSALRAGRSYAVLRFAEGPPISDVSLSDVRLEGGRLSVSFTGEPSTILFIGQDGVVKKMVENVTTADYAFSDADTYIRAELRSPRAVLYLNPVLRYDGTRFPAPVATPDATATWLLRSGALIFAALVLALPLVRRWRRRVPTHEPESSVTAANRNPA